jgi:hypothetical protein
MTDQIMRLSKSFKGIHLSLKAPRIDCYWQFWKMSSTSPTTLHFKGAMQSVYGPFETLPQDRVSQWTPPPKSGGHKGRYLWTDAFGVLSFLTLYHETSSEKYLTFAKSLVEIVHNVLGRTRDGTSRLPGATDNEPLKGGLRIGKIDAEGPDGDGQYHHYLTLWMFALNRLSVAARDRTYNAQAYVIFLSNHYPVFERFGCHS